MTLVRRSLMVLGAIAAVVTVAAFTQLPAIGAGALLHPFRRPVQSPPPPGCVDTSFKGADVLLRGWVCRASAPARGTVVYLHGVADNRESAAGVIARLRPAGFDVIAYDSRAHGESDGEFCTYGFFEKDDLRAVIDQARQGPVVLIGTSLGAAVALQHAPRDPRVTAVVAAEPFSDLRTIATERAPFFFPSGSIDKSFARAEQTARFSVDAVSPVRAAAELRIPVLLIHGDADVETVPDHSRRIFERLQGPKQLVLVRGAGHNHSLRDHTWRDVTQWLERVAKLSTRPVKKSA